MSIVEAEPKRDECSRGARSLYQASLDHSADTLGSEPCPRDLFEKLPPTIQRDLLEALLDDRRKRQDLERRLTKLETTTPLMDREVDLGIDKNAQFIQEHPQSFIVEYLPDPANEKSFWRSFLGAMDTLQHSAEGQKLRNSAMVWLTENSEDSLIRFSICPTFEYGEEHSSCPHREHFLPESLISPDLLMCRLYILEKGDGCRIEKDSWLDEDEIFGITWTHDDLVVRMHRGSSGPSVDVSWIGDGESIRSAEVYLNALLSPIESDSWSSDWSSKKMTGRNAFARRYVKLLTPDETWTTIGPGNPPKATCTNVDMDSY
jgi:hypothetical protein